MLLSDIAQYLHQQQLGKYDAAGVTGDVFISTIPASPDSILAIFPTGGGSPDRWNSGYSYPSIQIRVRGGRDPRPALKRAQDIIDALDGLSGVVLPSGTLIVSCSSDQSNPVHMGMDGSGRHEYSTNFSLQVKI